MSTKYENDRLIAYNKFVERLLTDKYRRENISDDVAELSSEIAEDFGHVINAFDQINPHIDEDFTRGTKFRFYDAPTDKIIKVSFEYENLSGGKDEV
mgnify:FL=1|tara:strand:- start:329 stop:619 length:291 start_codon:yes stop_codon:yes gene_type:complete